jgi:hypothetical protein
LQKPDRPREGFDITLGNLVIRGVATPPLTIGKILKLTAQREHQLLDGLLSAEGVCAASAMNFQTCSVITSGLARAGLLKSYCWSNHCNIKR